MVEVPAKTFPIEIITCVAVGNAARQLQQKIDGRLSESLNLTVPCNVQTRKMDACPSEICICDTNLFFVVKARSNVIIA